VPRRRFTAEEVDAAVQALSADAERFAHAQEIVTHAAPGLQKVLNIALDEGGWFGEDHQQAVSGVVGIDDPNERLTAVRTLIAEEVRLGMLVGVAVGLELARELYEDDDQRPEE
jgi:hypothetical protein